MLYGCFRPEADVANRGRSVWRRPLQSMRQGAQEAWSAAIRAEWTGGSLLFAESRPPIRLASKRAARARTRPLNGASSRAWRNRGSRFARPLALRSCQFTMLDRCGGLGALLTTLANLIEQLRGLFVAVRPLGYSSSNRLEVSNDRVRDLRLRHCGQVSPNSL